VISTGKRDWDKEVTEAKGTLAAYLVEAESNSTPLKTDKTENGSGAVKSFRGVYSSSKASRVSILNGSHYTVSDDSTKESVLIFPDYKLVTEVSSSSEGAQALWTSVLNPTLGPLERLPKEGTLKSWLIPYSCVILLCSPHCFWVGYVLIDVPVGSHKKRDNRCSIAAPKLEAGRLPPRCGRHGSMTSILQIHSIETITGMRRMGSTYTTSRSIRTCTTSRRT
jgi:hypothetical protein